MPRRARLDPPGTLHFVIVRGSEQRRIVDDDPDLEKFVERLVDLSQRSQTAIYAWSLMTNHAHLLLRSGPQGLSACMRKLLNGYAGAYTPRTAARSRLAASGTAALARYSPRLKSRSVGQKAST